MRKVNTVLTIAGTDPTGGAGIQADLKTFQERGVFGMSVVTSVVAQNTTGVQGVQHLPVDFIQAQLESVFGDIIPDAIKTGMIHSVEMMDLITSFLKKYPDIPYVLDPVMVASSGDPLMDEKTRLTIKQQLVPLATVVTPNLDETSLLLGYEVKTIHEMEKAAESLVNDFGARAAVVKGGHLVEGAVDVFYDGDRLVYLEADRVDTKDTHGTGCTFAACIASELAKGHDIHDSVQLAKSFVTDAIAYGLELGKGHGPTNHWGYRLKSTPNESEAYK